MNVCFGLSSLFDIWLLGGTNWYLMFMVVIVNFKAVDDLFFMKWKPEWIPRLLKSSVKNVKAFYYLLVISVLSCCSYDGITVIHIHDI